MCQAHAKDKGFLYVFSALKTSLWGTHIYSILLLEILRLGAPQVFPNNAIEIACLKPSTLKTWSR